MTAAASLRDSSPVLEADLGKEGKCRRLMATCFPFRCILPCMTQDKAPPLGGDRPTSCHATPAPHTSTDAQGASIAGLRPPVHRSAWREGGWQRPCPPICRHGHIWPSGHELFRPVQSALRGSVPATPETRHDPRGVPAPSETQPNRSSIGCRQGIAAALNPLHTPITVCAWILDKKSCTPPIIRKFPNADKDLRRLMVSAIVILDNSFTRTWSNSLYEPSS